MIAFGTCALANGEILKWNAVLTSPFVETPDSAEAREMANQTLISHLTYPNKAYGLTAPPKMENVLIRNATVWTSEAEGVLMPKLFLPRVEKCEEEAKRPSRPPVQKSVTELWSNSSDPSIDANALLNFNTAVDTWHGSSFAAQQQGRHHYTSVEVQADG